MIIPFLILSLVASWSVKLQKVALMAMQPAPQYGFGTSQNKLSLGRGQITQGMQIGRKDGEMLDFFFHLYCENCLDRKRRDNDAAKIINIDL